MRIISVTIQNLEKIRTISHLIPSPDLAQVGTIMDQWLEEAKAHEILKGKVETFLRLVDLKFGDLP